MSDAVSGYTVTGCRITNNGTGISLRGDHYVCTGNVAAGNLSNLIEGRPHVVADNAGL